MCWSIQHESDANTNTRNAENTQIYLVTKQPEEYCQPTVEYGEKSFEYKNTEMDSSKDITSNLKQLHLIIEIQYVK